MAAKRISATAIGGDAPTNGASASIDPLEALPDLRIVNARLLELEREKLHLRQLQRLLMQLRQDSEGRAAASGRTAGGEGDAG
jgi:hypothetical protein